MFKWKRKKVITDVQNMNNRIYKALLGEIKEQNKWRDIPCSEISFIIVNIYLDTQCSASQNLSRLFCRSRQVDSKIHTEMQKNVKNTILKKKIIII